MVRPWCLFLPFGLVSCGLIAMMAVTTTSDLDDSTAVLVAIIGIVSIFAVWFGAWFLGRRLQTAIDELSDTQSDLHQLLDDLPVAVLRLDEAGKISSANSEAVVLTGRSIDDLLGRGFSSMIGDEDRDSVTERWQQFDIGHGFLAAPVPGDLGTERAADLGADLDAGLGPRGSVVVELLGAEGERHLVEASMHVPRSATSRGTVVLLRDVTDLKRSSDVLGRARQRFQQAFHSAPTGMALVRLDDGRIVDTNESFAEMIDRPISEIVGQPIHRLTHEDDTAAAASQRAQLELGLADTYTLEQRYRRSDGIYVWARTRVSVTDDDDRTLAITHIEDITEQRRTAELLTYAATHDELTTLPNRGALVERLDGLLANAQPGQVAVLFIDLDNFKVVNDSLGHRVGDELLRVIAHRFRGVIRDGDRLARFGGDEFVMFIDRVAVGGDDRPTGAFVDPAAVADRLRRSVMEPIVIDGHELVVTASIGFAVNADDNLTANDLLRDADAAMYRAKEAGRDRVEAFTAATRRVSVDSLHLLSELRRAIARHEIVPYFQPIVDLRTGDVRSFEVLARWLHPDRGVLGPHEFLPTAESAGLMVDLGAAVLRDSLTQLAHWRALGLQFASCGLSVNIGTQQLVNDSFVEMVRTALSDTGIDADSLWLEITETALMRDTVAVSEALRALRGLGLHLAVDDFGTGYSSLTYLKRFPVETIKIDRSFVSGLGREVDGGSSVEAVIDLGHSLGLTVLAEGIETLPQLTALRELGCDTGQGYLFGRPRPASIIQAEAEQLDAKPDGAC